MAQRKKKGRPALRVVPQPTGRYRRGTFKLTNGMTIDLVVPRVELVDAETAYAVATALAKVAKEYVEAGDRKNPSPFFAAIGQTVGVMPDAQQGCPAGYAVVGVVRGIDAQGLREVEFEHVGGALPPKRAWFNIAELGECPA